MEYQSLIDIIERISSMLGEYEDKTLNSDALADLTVKQIYYIDMINKLTEPTVSELARNMDVTKPTVTVAVNKLIDQGYLEKVQSNEDRRVYNLLLTKKGKKVVQVHDQAHRGFARQLADSLEQNELENLVQIFKKVIEKNS